MSLQIKYFIILYFYLKIHQLQLIHHLICIQKLLIEYVPKIFMLKLFITLNVFRSSPDFEFQIIILLSSDPLIIVIPSLEKQILVIYFVCASFPSLYLIRKSLHKNSTVHYNFLNFIILFPCYQMQMLNLTHQVKNKYNLYNNLI